MKNIACNQENHEESRGITRTIRTTRTREIPRTTQLPWLKVMSCEVDSWRQLRLLHQRSAGNFYYVHSGHGPVGSLRPFEIVRPAGILVTQFLQLVHEDTTASLKKSLWNSSHDYVHGLTLTQLACNNFNKTAIPRRKVLAEGLKKTNQANKELSAFFLVWIS